MNIIILTPVRLLGDGLAACFRNHSDSTTVVVVKDIGSVRDILASTQIDVVLVDVTQGVNLYDIRAIAAEWSSVPIVALGLAEQRQEVVKCGRAGFASYVARDGSIDALYTALSDVAAGRLACPPEISGGLLRALFRREPHTAEEPTLNSALTQRECEVLDLVGRGFSNKEIGSELCLSVATVKHHVHHVLEKLNVSRRAEAMRQVRDAPWLARSGSIGKETSERQ
jgi:two-component system, NarL family, nitrate/nitrite response regulator NarL